MTYAELLRFVGNCEKLDLDFDLLIGSKLGKYIHLAYVMLIEINDTSSLGYMRLLPRISKIRKLCKEKILSFVSPPLHTPSNSLLVLGQKRIFEPKPAIRQK